MSRGSSWGKKFFRQLRSIVWCADRGRGGCGGRIEFAHIKPTPLTPYGRGRGLNSRALDILHHPDCYIALCATHHLMRDKKNRYTEKVKIAKAKATPEERRKWKQFFEVY